MEECLVSFFAPPDDGVAFLLLVSSLRMASQKTLIDDLTVDHFGLRIEMGNNNTVYLTHMNVPVCLSDRTEPTVTPSEKTMAC